MIPPHQPVAYQMSVGGGPWLDWWPYPERFLRVPYVPPLKERMRIKLENGQTVIVTRK